MQREDFIIRTWPFLLVTFIFCITAMTAAKFYGETDFHLLLNSYHSPLADVFFEFYTKTGEWIFGGFILIWLLWKSSRRMVLIFVTATVLQLFTVQILKRGLFIDHLRPAYYFMEKGTDLHLVDGIQQGITFTFPSGHTATAFFVFVFLCLMIRNRWAQFGLGLLAVLSAYSRIYLSQHFVLDTVAGAVIGIGITIFAYYYWHWPNLPQLDKKLDVSKKKN